MHANRRVHADEPECRLQHRHDDDAAADAEESCEDTGHDTGREHGDSYDDEFRHRKECDRFDGVAVVGREGNTSQARQGSRSFQTQSPPDDRAAFFDADDPVRRDFAAINALLSGAVPLFVVLNAEEAGAFRDPELLRRIERRLRREVRGA